MIQRYSLHGPSSFSWMEDDDNGDYVKLVDVIEAQKAEVVKSSSTDLLNAIVEDLNGMIKGRREQHDRMDWPHKFLVAHEGIGLIKAIEVIEAHRKDTGI